MVDCSAVYHTFCTPWEVHLLGETVHGLPQKMHPLGGDTPLEKHLDFPYKIKTISKYHFLSASGRGFMPRTVR